MAEAARIRDVIDTSPAFTQADADALNARFEGVDARTMLAELFAEGTLGRAGVVSSFGTESAALLHLVAETDPGVPVIFVDTLKMFDETNEYRTTLIERLGLTNASVVQPDADVQAARDAVEAVDLEPLDHEVRHKIYIR